MKQRHKQLIIAFFTFIGGLYFFLEFLLPQFLTAVLPTDALPGTLLGYEYRKIHDAIIRGVQVVGVMAIGLGIINILRVHGGNIVKSKKGWGNSCALLVGLFGVIVIQGVDFANFEKSDEKRRDIDNLALFVERIQEDFHERKLAPFPRVRALDQVLDKLEREEKARLAVMKPNGDVSQKALVKSIVQVRNRVGVLKRVYEDKGKRAQKTQSRKLISALKSLAAKRQDIAQREYTESLMKKADHFVFTSFFTPLGSAMFSLLAFYIATAAYRSFRIRSFEAFVMMVPAIIVMLGQIPHGPLYISPHLPRIRFWLLENISTPAFRAITFGALIASLAMAVRMWLSLEKSPLAGDDEALAEGEGR